MRITGIFLLSIIFSITNTGFSQGVAINNNGASTHTSSILDISSTTLGVLIPRMTLAERDLIATPIETGLVIFQTDNAPGVYYYNGTIWEPIGLSAGGDVDWTISGNNIYSAVSGNVGVGTNSPDASAKLDISSTTKGFLPPRMTTSERDNISNPEPGLIIYNTDIHCLEYYQNATSGWYNECIFNEYCGEKTVFRVVSAANYTWLDRNLGANRVATASTDYQGYGSLYQWGRLSDDHECINWTSGTTGTALHGTTGTTSSSDIPGHSSFITTIFMPYDWRDPQNDFLWQGTSGGNNPCPPGFRIPIEPELEALRTTFSTNDAAGAYASSVKFTTPGYRQADDGTLSTVGTFGFYHSSTNVDRAGRQLLINGTNSYMQGNDRAYGFSVRCIQDYVMEGGTTSLCGTTQSYDTVHTAGYIWHDRNLGAARVAYSEFDYGAYGSVFQWGRLSDNHECINWTAYNAGTPANGTTSTLSSSDVPGHSNFITTSSSPNDWRTPQNASLWQGVSGINNPCPSGFRLPTITEAQTLLNSFSPQNAEGSWNSPVKLTVAGGRSYSSGNLNYTGSYGLYWSSTTSGNNSETFVTTSSSLSTVPDVRSGGNVVRCIMD